MIHYIRINEKNVKVNIFCAHPEIKNTTCQTGYGKCETCKHARVELLAESFLELWDEYQDLKILNDYQ